MSNIEPQHKQSKADKIKNNFAENIAMYYIQQANILGADRKELQMLYDAADGLVDEATYAYVLNPYHTENDKLKKFPARLRNYDILSPVLKLWMGEQLRKPKGATITAFPADSENRKKQFIAENVNSALLQDFINNLNQMGVETEMATKQIEEYQKTVQRVEASFNDIMCQNGQEAFDYLYASLNIDDRIQEMLFDFIVVGRYFTFKRVYLDDVDYEVCDPRDIYIVGWGKSPYAEDADAAIRVMNMTANNVLDNFQDAIFAHDKAEEIVQWLSDIKSNSSVAQGTGSLLLNSVGNVNGFNVDHEGSRNAEITRGFDASLVTVYHITYKTFTKVGILKYYNQIGEIEKKEVDEDYRLNKTAGDISIEWIWINEVHEVYRLADKYIIGAGPLPVQRNRMNNPSVCKLPYNGRIMGYRNAVVMSPYKSGLNYQVLYNIFHYRFELLLAKNKDKILTMPYGLIPDSEDFDTDKFFYWMAADGILFYDDAKPRAAAMISGIKSVDMSLGNYMDKMWQFMTQIKEEYWDSIGMNRQRYGDSYASDGKANTQQAIFRSGTITADMFHQLDKGLEADYNGLIDYTKVAWLKGKKGMYLNSDKKRAFLKLTAEDMLRYMDTEFGAFAKNSTEEFEKTEEAKKLLLTMGQNGLGADHMISILAANNISKIETLAKEGVAIEREFQQSQNQANNEAMLKAEEMRSTREADKNQTIIQVANIKAESDIEVALIGADASLVDVLNNTSVMEDSVAANAGNNAMVRIDERQNASKQQSEVLKQVGEQDKRNLFREKMVNDLKIARTNKN